jgi:hypothetical protein
MHSIEIPTGVAFLDSSACGGILKRRDDGDHVVDERCEVEEKGEAND